MCLFNYDIFYYNEVDTLISTKHEQMFDNPFLQASKLEKWRTCHLHRWLTYTISTQANTEPHRHIVEPQNIKANTQTVCTCSSENQCLHQNIHPNTTTRNAQLPVCRLKEKKQSSTKESSTYETKP